MHFVRLFLDALIPSHFHYIDCRQWLFILLYCRSYRPNQSGNIRCGTNNPLLRGVSMLTAVVQFHIGYIVCLPVALAFIWIIQIPIPVKPIFGVWIAFWWTILITPGRMAVDMSDSANIQYLSSSSREVLCRQSWWHRWFCDNLNAAAPSCPKSDQNALTIYSVSEMYPTTVISVFWARYSFCAARRFWLPSHISKKSWTLAIQCNFFCLASRFISMSFWGLIGSTSGTSPASNLLIARANSLTTTFSRRLLPVVFDSFHLTTSCAREKLASTLTSCGMINNMSRATFERSAYFECISSCCRHQWVMSGNQNLLLI